MMPGPLSGRRIIVTRSRMQAGSLGALLQAEGAEVIEFPTIRIAPPPDFTACDRAIARIAEYRWIVFTSQNGVGAFLERLRASGRGTDALASALLAAIGPATARALEAHGLGVTLAPKEFVAEALVDAFAACSEESIRGARVLLPRALEARSILPEGLRALGAAVDVVPVYRVEVEHEQDRRAWRRLLAGEADALTFTSPSTVRGFVKVLGADATGIAGRTLVACIGPITAAAAGDCGLAVGLVAKRYTIPGLVAALRAHLGSAASAAGR
jgi:uroporphyrinogen III methyltransferase / synthase